MKRTHFIPVLLSLLASVALQMLVDGSSFSQDLSVLSEFGTSDITKNGSVVVQSGSANSAEISQVIDAGGSTGHYAEVVQTGTENQAIVDQSGDLNRARLNQNGSSNYGNILQNGFENYFDAIQIGYGNSLYATQAGTANSIFLTQPGFATANVVEIGNRNTVNATQTLGSNITIRIEGNGMTATVRQN